jgi:hypothetical protein
MCYYMDEPWKHHTKRSEPDAKGVLWFHLEEVLGKLTEKKEWWLPGAKEEGS